MVQLDPEANGTDFEEGISPHSLITRAADKGAVGSSRSTAVASSLLSDLNRTMESVRVETALENEKNLLVNRLRIAADSISALISANTLSRAADWILSRSCSKLDLLRHVYLDFGDIRSQRREALRVSFETSVEISQESLMVASLVCNIMEGEIKNSSNTSSNLLQLNLTSVDSENFTAENTQCNSQASPQPPTSCKEKNCAIGMFEQL